MDRQTWEQLFLFVHLHYNTKWPSNNSGLRIDPHTHTHFTLAGFVRVCVWMQAISIVCMLNMVKTSYNFARILQNPLQSKLGEREKKKDDGKWSEKLKLLLHMVRLGFTYGFVWTIVHFRYFFLLYILITYKNI